MQVLKSATEAQRKEWFCSLAFALACCHTNGVFHEDIADRLSVPTINAIVGDILTLIDLGDSQTPTTPDEVQDALRKDMEGLGTFAEYLYPEGAPEYAKKMYTDKGHIQKLSVAACKQFVAQELSQAGYNFPAGWGGILGVQREAEQPSPLFGQ